MNGLSIAMRNGNDTVTLSKPIAGTFVDLGVGADTINANDGVKSAIECGTKSDGVTRDGQVDTVHTDGLDTLSHCAHDNVGPQGAASFF